MKTPPHDDPHARASAIKGTNISVATTERPAAWEALSRAKAWSPLDEVELLDGGESLDEEGLFSEEGPFGEEGPFDVGGGFAAHVAVSVSVPALHDLVPDKVWPASQVGVQDEPLARAAVQAEPGEPLVMAPDASQVAAGNIFNQIFECMPPTKPALPRRARTFHG